MALKNEMNACFIMSNALIAFKKKITLPRMELLGAFITCPYDNISSIYVSVHQYESNLFSIVS